MAFASITLTDITETSELACLLQTDNQINSSYGVLHIIVHEPLRANTIDILLSYVMELSRVWVPNLEYAED